VASIDIAPVAGTQVSENTFYDALLIGGKANVRSSSQFAVNNTFYNPRMSGQVAAPSGGNTDYNVKADAGEVLLYSANFEGCAIADIFLGTGPSAGTAVWGGISESTAFLTTGANISTSRRLLVQSFVHNNPAAPAGNGVQIDLSVDAHFIGFSTNMDFNIGGSTAASDVVFIGGSARAFTGSTGKLTRIGGGLALRQGTAPADGEIILGVNDVGIQASIAAGTLIQLLKLNGNNRLELNLNSTLWTLTNPLTQTTVGAAGGASALPATPTGYLRFEFDGVQRVIPFYTQ
jgi:hypothetical protein